MSIFVNFDVSSHSPSLGRGLFSLFSHDGRCSYDCGFWGGVLELGMLLGTTIVAVLFRGKELSYDARRGRAHMFLARKGCGAASGGAASVWRLIQVYVPTNLTCSSSLKCVHRLYII